MYILCFMDAQLQSVSFTHVPVRWHVSSVILARIWLFLLMALVSSRNETHCELGERDAMHRGVLSIYAPALTIYVSCFVERLRLLMPVKKRVSAGAWTGSVFLSIPYPAITGYYNVIIHRWFLNIGFKVGLRALIYISQRVFFLLRMPNKWALIAVALRRVVIN